MAHKYTRILQHLETLYMNSRDIDYLSTMRLKPPHSYLRVLDTLRAYLAAALL